MTGRPLSNTFSEEAGRPSAEDMDEKRKADLAYEYLCRLEEIRNWFAECLNDNAIAKSVELEENLRNGVLLARMANFFAPSVVSTRRIFDLDQRRYSLENRLDYRHTDNLMHWRRAMANVGLPEVFYPDTADVYDRKNMPKTIFCLHALAVHLYRRRLAPPIRDISANVAFTEEEIAMVSEALTAHGHRLPPFKEVGGILTDQLSADEMEVHRAVVAINEAIDDKETKELIRALENHKAGIDFVSKSAIDAYLRVLGERKNAKISAVKCPEQSIDMYDVMLSRLEIQRAIDRVNQEDSLSKLNQCLLNGDVSCCFFNLSELHLPRLIQSLSTVYLTMLQQKRDHLARRLDFADVSDVIQSVNGLMDVKVAVLSDDEKGLMKVLGDKHLNVEDVHSCNGQAYMQVLAGLFQAGNEDLLLNRDDIQQAIRHANTSVSVSADENDFVAQMQKALTLAGDMEAVCALLNDTQNGLKDVNANCLPLYASNLRSIITSSDDQLREEFTLSLDEIQDVIDISNMECLEAIRSVKAAFQINEAVHRGDSVMQLLHILSVHAELLQIDVRPEIAAQYALSLKQKQRYKFDNLVETGDQGEGSWVIEQVSSMPLYVNVNTYEISSKKPHHLIIIRYYLSRAEIKEAITVANKVFDEECWKRQETVIRLQARIKGHLIRKQYDNHLVKKRRNEQNAAKIIQSFYRKHKGARDYQSLKDGTRPSLRLVRTFASLLIRTEADYEEEITAQRLKEVIVKKIRHNRQMEDDLAVMDMKIGLLVKNRLDIDDVMRHGEKLNSDGKRSSMNGVSSSHKAIIRQYRDRLNCCQHLLYHIQTEPEYLTRLLLSVNTAKLKRLIDSVIFPLFNYGTHGREEYLFLTFLRMALQEEIRRQIDTVDQFVAAISDLIVPKIILHWARQVLQGEIMLKELLEKPISELIADTAESEHLNTDPLQIYKCVVGDVEKGLSAEKAARHEQVSPLLNRAIDCLSHWTDQFISVIVNGKEKIPYGLRYMAKVLDESLRNKCQSAPDSEIDKAVGHLVYTEYIGSAICCADSLQILPSNKTLSDTDRNKLNSVAKLLQYGCANKGYGQDKVYLMRLNGKIRDWNRMFGQFLANLKSVDNPETKLGIEGIDRYSDYTAVHKPVVYIGLADLLFFHQLLVEYRETIAPDCTDKMHSLIDETSETLSRLRELTDKESSLSVQLTLTLSPRPPSLDQFTSSNDIHKILFLTTKKYVIDLLLSQKGDSLKLLLDSPTTYFDQKNYESLRQNNKAFVDQFESLDAKKAQIRQNLHTLEQNSLVSVRDDYQSLVTAIALDIRKERRYRDKRKSELGALRETVERLEKKTRFYDEQADTYRHYLDTCLQKLNRNQARASIRLHNNDNNDKNDKAEVKKRQSMTDISRRTVKYSGEKLHKKAVLLSLQSLQQPSKNHKQLSKISFEIKSESTAGLFTVTMKYANESESEQDTIKFQDLLQAEYEGEEQVVLFGKVHFSVKQLILLLNKKFYAQ